MNILKLLLLCIIISSISGCATFGQMDSGLNSLMGKSEREAFSALGYPDSEQTIAGDTVYQWGHRSTGVFMTPQTTTTRGYVGTIPYSASSTNYTAVPYEALCNIKIITRNGVVINYSYNGNIAGCGGYIERINAYVKQNSNANFPVTTTSSNDEYKPENSAKDEVPSEYYSSKNYSSDNLPKGEHEIEACISKAIDGDTSSQKALGKLFESSPEESIRWYKMAADSGDEEAKALLRIKFNK